MGEETNVDETAKALEAMKAENAKLKQEFEKILAKNDELLGETKQAKAAKREAEEKSRSEAEELAKKSGDIAALEKSWQDKLNKQAEDLKGQVSLRDQQINKLLVDNVAVGMANEIAIQGSADLIMPHIKQRLRTELKDGQLVTVVYDKDGKPSALTVDELKNEFVSNPAFSPVIVGSKASGSGAPSGKSSGATQKTMKRAEFDKMDSSQRMSIVKEGVTVID